MAEIQRDIWTLFDTSDIPADGNLSVYLSNATKKCADWFSASGASLFLKGERNFKLVAQAGMNSNVPADASVKLGRGLAGKALVEGKAKLLHEGDKKFASAMIVPLIAFGPGRVGVLNLSRADGQPQFTRRDLKDAETVANQIALAVSNALLIQRLIESKTAEASASAELARISRLAEIGQMTAAVAHEIRNPLTGIKSAAQLIAKNPELGAEFAGIIEDEVEKLNILCDEFLEFSRPLALRCQHGTLGAIAQRLVSLMLPEFRGRAVDLQLEIESNLPTIKIDPVRFEQVMRNLLQNALQACVGGGTVTVRVDAKGVTVTDTGVGMNEEALQKLFTPFFTSKPDGTGLGLCNVRKIVDAHGGTIQVHSEPGKGSNFRVELGKAA